MGKAIWEELRGWNRWIRTGNDGNEKDRLFGNQLGEAGWGTGPAHSLEEKEEEKDEEERIIRPAPK